MDTEERESLLASLILSGHELTVVSESVPQIQALVGLTRVGKLASGIENPAILRSWFSPVFGRLQR